MVMLNLNFIFHQFNQSHLGIVDGVRGEVLFKKGLMAIHCRSVEVGVLGYKFQIQIISQILSIT